MADFKPIVISSGRQQQLPDADTIIVGGVTTNLTPGALALDIFPTLGAGDSITIGSAGSTVNIPGDLSVTGTETVSNTLTAEGDVNLGNNTGDTITLGGGTNDSIVINSDMTVGAGLVDLGSGTSDYLAQAWLQAVNDNGPDLDAYNLNESGTNAGAYSIGIDPSLLAASAATDLMTVLDDLDAAIAASGSTLQQAYEAGNTIAVTTAEGSITLSNSADTTDILTIDHTFAGAGNAIDVSMGGTSTDAAIVVDHAAGAAGLGTIMQMSDGTNESFGFSIAPGGAARTALFLGGNAAAADSDRNGPNISILAGAGASDAAAAGFDGGNLAFTAGAGGTGVGTDGDGGALTFTAGNGDLGGSVTINAGEATTGSTDGNIVLNSNSGIVGITQESVTQGTSDVIPGLSFTDDNGNISEVIRVLTVTGAPNGQVTLGGIGSLALEETGAAYIKTANPSTWTELGQSGGDLQSLDQVLTVGGTGGVDNTVDLATGQGITLTDANSIDVLTITVDEGTSNAIVLSSDNGADGLTSSAIGDGSTAIVVNANDGGAGISVNANATGTGTAVAINAEGTKPVLIAQKSGADVLNIDGDGNFTVTTPSNENVSLSAFGTGTAFLGGNGGVEIEAGATADLDLTARGATIPLNEVGDTALDGAFTATSIVGALNELQADQTGDSVVIELPIENGVTITANDLVAVSTVSGRVTQANGGSDTNQAYVIGVAQNTGTGDAGGTVNSQILVQGIADATGLTAGAPVYLDTSAGDATSTAPTGSGEVVQRVGMAFSTTQYVYSLGERVLL